MSRISARGTDESAKGMERKCPTGYGPIATSKPRDLTRGLAFPPPRASQPPASKTEAGHFFFREGSSDQLP